VGKWKVASVGKALLKASRYEAVGNRRLVSKPSFEQAIRELDSESVTTGKAGGFIIVNRSKRYVQKIN